MPYLDILYSSQLGTRHDIAGFCDVARQSLHLQACFSEYDINVVARPAKYQSMGDGHPLNASVDMVLRVAPELSAEDRRATGGALMQAAELFFENELEGAHFVLNLEILAGSEDFRWRTNTMIQRLGGE